MNVKQLSSKAEYHETIMKYGILCYFPQNYEIIVVHRKLQSSNLDFVQIVTSATKMLHSLEFVGSSCISTLNEFMNFKFLSNFFIHHNECKSHYRYTHNGTSICLNYFQACSQ